MTTRLTLPTSIHVEARRWFHQGPGNTYLTALATLSYEDGTEHQVEVHFTYGYGEHYMTEAHEAIVKAGHLPENKSNYGGLIPLWQVCQDNGIELSQAVKDVRRRSDLHWKGK